MSSGKASIAEPAAAPAHAVDAAAVKEVEHKLAKYRLKLAQAKEDGLESATADYELKLQHWTLQQRRLFQIQGGAPLPCLSPSPLLDSCS